MDYLTTDITDGPWQVQLSSQGDLVSRLQSNITISAYKADGSLSTSFDAIITLSSDDDQAVFPDPFPMTAQSFSVYFALKTVSNTSVPDVRIYVKATNPSNGSIVAETHFTDQPVLWFHVKATIFPLKECNGSYSGTYGSALACGSYVCPKGHNCPPELFGPGQCSSFVALPKGNGNCGAGVVVVGSQGFGWSGGVWDIGPIHEDDRYWMDGATSTPGIPDATGNPDLRGIDLSDAFAEEMGYSFKCTDDLVPPKTYIPIDCDDLARTHVGYGVDNIPASSESTAGVFKSGVSIISSTSGGVYWSFLGLDLGMQ